MLTHVVIFSFVRLLANPPVFLVTSLPQSEASRRSAEYVRMPPSQPKISRLQGERSQSFSSYSPPPPFDHLNRHGPMSAGHGQYGPLAVKRPPIVYPALLSRVANAFVQRITTSPRIKDSIEYKDCFDGRDAVVGLYELSFGFICLTQEAFLTLVCLWGFRFVLCNLGQDRFYYQNNGQELGFTFGKGSRRTETVP